MAQHEGRSLKDGFSFKLFASYALDWIVLVVIVVAGGFLGRIEPNKRPFSLDDPNISFPFTESETVPAWLLVVLCALVPVVVILFVSIVLIPGSNMPKNMPHSLIWKRKLWELHVGWLGLLMAVGSAFFFVSGIKNMCGKPRPDLLSRCQPDIANAAKYIVGGFSNESARARLYSGDICKQTDKYKLDDGFRSYPSGHAAASAAGLIYLSLFLASKFSVTIPFVVSHGAPLDDSAHAAFPSRMNTMDAGAGLGSNGYESTGLRNGSVGGNHAAALKSTIASHNAEHNSRLQSLRRQAAAPPVYLLAITLVPFCVAIFISASRWFDFRHHGFDILFGFLIGTITAIYSFRYYHLPIMAGAGWAWGPRSVDRAFWAGTGRLGYAGDNFDCEGPSSSRRPVADLGESGSVDLPRPGGVGPSVNHRGQMSGHQNGYEDVEMNDYERRAGGPTGSHPTEYGQAR